MRVLGIVVEYNPFHNGHKFHLTESKKYTAPDITIAVMSGSFLQRGEPALADKWTRAEMALSEGVDIVIELPFQYAVQKAEFFADGAVASLKELGVTNLCFGSESGNIADFYQTAEWVVKNREALDQLIKKHTAHGKSYPRSFSDAFQELRKDAALIDLSQPNNILGFHYVQACSKYSINAETILRSGASHNEEELSSEAEITSATSLRKHLKTFPLSSIASYVPEETLRLLKYYKNTYGKLHDWEDYFPLFQYKLFTMRAEELKNIYECEEGLENRMIRYRTARSFEEFIESVKTKRYTRTRLQRLCTHILMDSQKTTLKIAAEKPPDSLRLLGMNKKGRHYLNSIKKNLHIPIVTKAQDIQSSSAAFSANAADIHALALNEEKRRYDFEHKVIIKDE